MSVYHDSERQFTSPSTILQRLYCIAKLLD